MAGYGYTSLTMEVRTQIESVGARMGRFMSCIGQERMVAGVLSGVLVGVVILILVVSMVSIRDNTERGDDLKSAYIKGIINFNSTLICLPYNIRTYASYLGEGRGSVYGDG